MDTVREKENLHRFLVGTKGMSEEVFSESLSALESVPPVFREYKHVVFGYQSDIVFINVDGFTAERLRKSRGLGILESYLLLADLYRRKIQGSG